MGDVITHFFLLNDPLRGGTNDSGKQRQGQGGQEEPDEKHRHQIPTSSSDARLCIMQRGDSHGHTVSAAYFTRCNGSHYSHNSQNFLKFFPLRIIE